MGQVEGEQGVVWMPSSMSMCWACQRFRFNISHPGAFSLSDFKIIYDSKACSQPEC
jgi:hypothetical protein